MCIDIDANIKKKIVGLHSIDVFEFPCSGVYFIYSTVFSSDNSLTEYMNEWTLSHLFALYVKLYQECCSDNSHDTSLFYFSISTCTLA